MSVYRRRIVIAFLSLLLFAGLAWIGTRTYGPEDACHGIEKRIPARFRRVERSEWGKAGNYTYYCEAVAIAPWIVRIEYGGVCGPLCGGGAVEVDVWLPGYVHELYRESSWVN